MLRQLVSRNILGRASSSASASVTSSLSSSSSCYSSHAYGHSVSASSFSFSSPHNALRCFSSSSSSQPSSSSSSTDIPPNFYQNPYGENISLESEETTFTGQSKYLIPGPFGTMEKPAIIYSESDSRIVGCEGGDGLVHQLQWFMLKKGPKHVCQDCGQVFQLQFAPAGHESSVRSWLGESPSEHHHDEHHDNHHGDGKKDKHY